MVTPVLLTFNEEANVDATLRSLAWASRVVVLDSGSTDRTEQIARSFGNVDWRSRSFDNHCSQWRFAIHETSITTEHVLALDADMRAGTGFIDELQRFLGQGNFAGALVPFEYRVLGQGLLSSIYPAQIRIFRKDLVNIDQPGHTQVFRVTGPVYRFHSPLIHEDHKPISRWLNNQANYAKLEAARIRSARKKGLRDWLRTSGLSPAVWGAYSYLRAGGPINAKAARAYAYERLIFEAILARILTENDKGTSAV